MIGIVLVTHGRLANEFLAALEHVVGDQEQIVAVSIGPDDDMERRRVDILKAVEAVNDGDGVVVLTDMFGGTPSNLAISIMDRSKVEVIAGVNLPMLIKLAGVRGEMENLLYATHYTVMLARSRHQGWTKQAAQQASSLLRYVQCVAADKAFYEAGEACRQAGMLNSAFVFLNRQERS